MGGGGEGGRGRGRGNLGTRCIWHQHERLITSVNHGGCVNFQILVVYLPAWVSVPELKNTITPVSFGGKYEKGKIGKKRKIEDKNK